jgi:hypothetical protein
MIFAPRSPQYLEKCMLIVDRPQFHHPGLSVHVAVTVVMAVFVTSNVLRGRGMWVYSIGYVQRLKNYVFTVGSSYECVCI